MEKSHTPLNKTASFNLTMIHNWCLTLMILLYYLILTYKIKRQHTALFIYTFFLSLLYIWFHSFYTYKQSTTVSTAQYSDKGDHSLLHLIYGDALESTEASRPRVDLESHTQMLAFFISCLHISGRVYFWCNVVRSSSEQSVSYMKNTAVRAISDWRFKKKISLRGGVKTLKEQTC